MKVRWLLRAVEDLEALRRFVAEDDPLAARREVRRVLDAAARLGRMPAMGRPGRVSGTREWLVSAYFMVYRVRDQRVEILRVLHQARQWPPARN